jgi:hypothetical protein
VLESLILTGGKIFATKTTLLFPPLPACFAGLHYFRTRYAIGCKKFVSTTHALFQKPILFLCVDYAAFFIDK